MILHNHTLSFRHQVHLILVVGITMGEDGVLTIERVKKDDEGLYECIASNVEGTARTSAVVTVLGRSQDLKY